MLLKTFKQILRPFFRFWIKTELLTFFRNCENHFGFRQRELIRYFISSLRCAIQWSIIQFVFGLMNQKRRILLNFFFGFFSFRIPLSINQFLITSHWSSSELMTARRKGSMWKLPISDASMKSSSASSESILSLTGNAWDKETSSKTKIKEVFMPWVWRKDWWWLSDLVKLYREGQRLKMTRICRYTYIDVI